MLNTIEVPPLSVYELSVCNTVSEPCQRRDNMYSCDIYIYMTDINAMLNYVCTELPSCFICLYLLYYCIKMYVKMCTSCTNKYIYTTRRTTHYILL